MDIELNAALIIEEHGMQGNSRSSDVANETEARSPKIGPYNCPVAKYETESSSCASVEDVKTNCDEAGNLPKDGSQPILRNTESPEPSCSICLGKMENKSFTNSCFHQFCFSCLLEWSKVKPECPLCKQPFKSIVHNVRSMEDYDQYHLRSDDFNTWENPDGRRFRYRSTLTSERRRELTLGRFLMSHRIPTRAADQPRSSSRHLFTTSDYRRHVYESGLWVRAQPATRSSRYREASPAFYVQNPACTHRLIPWLNRELNALEFGHQVAFLMELILSLIQRFHIQSPEFRELVQPYFLGNTNHFIHEFYNFARSPYDMVDYDRRISYADNLSLVAEDTDSDSDIIVLSPDRTSRPRWSQRALQPSPRTLSTGRDHTAVLNRARDFLETVAMFSSWPLDSRPSTSAMSLPSTTTIASPEPGPSGLQSASRSKRHDLPRLQSVITVPTPIAQRVKPELTITEEDEDDDCMIIGYEEPLSQPRPLDVIVLSDSDDDVIMEMPMQVAVASGPSLIMDASHQSPEMVSVVSESQEHKIDNESNKHHSGSSALHMSRSLSPVHPRKESKHHKRVKDRHPRSTSRSKSSPSVLSSSCRSRHRHREKRRHKHSVKTSGYSKSPSHLQETESSENGHSHHKSSKKKHSHKHKSSKSRDHKTSSSSFN